jgi:hypothetical protein
MAGRVGVKDTALQPAIKGISDTDTSQTGN